MNGAERIADERQRQINEEGFTVEHDADHAVDQLAIAAACYAMPEPLRQEPAWEKVPFDWPWDPSRWKPTPENRIRELEKAGALIAAEIDRLLADGARWVKDHGYIDWRIEDPSEGDT